jgi:uncharacterized 2Fe-2S/4Fe-4S cluster protein (DUF4445 family)
LVIRLPRLALAQVSGEYAPDLRGGEQEIPLSYRERLRAAGFGPDSGLRLVELCLTAPTLDDPRADRERLLSELARVCRAESAGLSLSVPLQRRLPTVLRAADFQARCLLREETPGKYTVLALAPPAQRPALLGLALDIGTTSVSAVLADLETGAPVVSASAGNGQIAYGADVINRIMLSARPGGLERLQAALTEGCLAPLLQNMCASRGLWPEQVTRVAVAANTAMTHLFAGVWAEYIRLEPYAPAFFALEGLRGADIGLEVDRAAEVLVAPSIGSYVGGDITAGVFAAGLPELPGCSVLIDLGTNGEIVLSGEDFIIACACSAGPAFEGGDISCGMRAAAGAVEHIAIDPISMAPTLSVIGPPGTLPAGLCGSGLIDAVAELFRAGVINARGRVVRTGPRVRRDESGLAAYVLASAAETRDRDITLTEIDIDNYIRAKGAIFSALRCMLAAADLRPENLDRVLIAGGIGSGINIRNAVTTGMLPNLPAERFHCVGNTSLLGAYGMLISRAAAAAVRKIAAGMTYLEMSAYPGYMDEFVAACFLPHTDGALFGRVPA